MGKSEIKALAKTVKLTIPVLICGIGLMGLLYYANMQDHTVELENRALERSLTCKTTMMAQLSESILDLLYVADLTRAAIVRDTAWQTPEGVLSLVDFSRRKKIYDQIRFIAPDGEERFRINYNNGLPAFVPQDDLQNKKDRYYVTETLKLWNGSIYISPLDLNMENGVIEQPRKPTLRLATPIYDNEMNLCGVVVVNLCGSRLLHLLEDSALVSQQSFLLNSDGYWLKGRRQTEEFGFMYPDNRNDRFQTAYPAEWNRMAATGEGAFSTRNGVFAFSTIELADIIDMATTLGNGQQKTHWKIVTHVPANVLTTQASAFAVPLGGIFLLLASGLSFAMYRLVQHQEKRKTAEASLIAQNVAYARFVPEEFCTLMGKTGLPEVELSNCVNCHMAVLFSDIRSFTRFSEGTDNQQVFRMLNDYFSSIDLSIKNNHGFIDKYIGDAVMALFPQSADDALQGALDMRRHIDKFNERQQETGGHTIVTGIGIHYGEVTLGALGTMRRMQTTAIGDTVNLASRIEGATKQYGVDVLVSDSVVTMLSDPSAFRLRKIDVVRVKGKETPVTLFEAFDCNRQELVKGKTASLPVLGKAMTAYASGDFAAALDLFEQCEVLCPDDPIPQLYSKRCHTLMRINPGADWAGISTL